jgi:hypothetical protein
MQTKDTTTTTTEQEQAAAGWAPVHFGQLEDLLAECAPRMGAPPSSQGRQPAYPPIIRISTQHVSRQTGTPSVTLHTLKVIITAHVWHAGDAFPHTGVWVWLIDEFETWHGKASPGCKWTPHHAYTLLDAALEELASAIGELTGASPRKGMYTELALVLHWLTPQEQASDTQGEHGNDKD